MTGPYEGLRVLDFSHVIAGPFCTRLLADLGADVVRVEPRTGDVMRRLPIAYGETLSSAFAQYNVGKRSVSVDLKHEEGRDLALGLVEWADVVVENFSPGTFRRLGFGYEELRARNPRVILCSLSTFGATGPYADLSGFGMVAEAYSGLMALTGEEGGPPMHFGTPLADMNSAVHALAAIGAALFRRAATGEGTHVDVSSFDALFAMIDQAVALGAFTGGERTFGRYGTTHPTTVPSGVVRVASGEHVTFAAVGDGQFAALADAMDRPDLASDSRFATVEARIDDRDALYGLIRGWAASFDDAETLVSRLRRHGLAAARVRTVEENLADPHLTARGTLSAVEARGVGTVLLQAAPYRLEGCSTRRRHDAPEIGEHTSEVLAGVLGLSAAEVAALHERGIAYSTTSGQE